MNSLTEENYLKALFNLSQEHGEVSVNELSKHLQIKMPTVTSMMKKLAEKNADIIVLNSLKDAGAGFGYNTNKVTIFDRRGNESAFDTKSKQHVAADIVNTIIEYRK